MFQYKAKIIKVVDGDTLDLEIDLGFGVSIKERVRLYGIDTPEIFRVSQDSDEYVRGMQAKKFVEVMASGDSNIIVKTYKDKKGKYGRYLAEIFIDDISLNKLLLEKGYAKKWEN